MTYTYNNTNLAYDLSKFDADEIKKRREASKKEDEKPAIMIKEAVPASKKGSKFKIAAAAALAFGAFCAVNYSETKKDDMARLVSEQAAQLRSVSDDNALLQGRLDSMANTAYIEKYAEEKLGMSKITPSQKKYISVNVESLVKVDAEDKGLFDGVKDWFDDVMEYIGF